MRAQAGRVTPTFQSANWPVGKPALRVTLTFQSASENVGTPNPRMCLGVRRSSAAVGSLEPLQSARGRAQSKIWRKTIDSPVGKPAIRVTLTFQSALGPVGKPALRVALVGKPALREMCSCRSLRGGPPQLAGNLPLEDAPHLRVQTRGQSPVASNGRIGRQEFDQEPQPAILEFQFHRLTQRPWLRAFRSPCG